MDKKKKNYINFTKKSMYYGSLANIPIKLYKYNNESYVLLDKNNKNIIGPKDIKLRSGYGDNEKIYFDSGKENAAKLKKIWSKHFKNQRANKILDFGCAAGRVTRHLKNQFSSDQIYGCDLSAERIYWAQQNYGKWATFFCNPSNSGLPFESNSFSLIFCGSVFTHLDELFEFWLFELARVISPNGLIIFTVFEETAVKRYYEGKTAEDFELWMKNWKPVLSKLKKKGWLKASVDRKNGVFQFVSNNYLKKIIEKFGVILEVSPDHFPYQTTYVVKKL